MMKNKSMMRILIVVVMVVVIIILVVCIRKQLAPQEQDEPVSETVVSVDQPEEKVELAQIPIDFSALQEENSDIYAWIRIPDTPVDYPVLRNTEEDDYYLERTVDGKEGLPGSLYTQASYNKKDFSDKVTLIYGHNMRDKSFFGSLDEYAKEAYREEHAVMYVYTPNKVFTYELAFAVTYNNKHILGLYECNTDAAGYQEFLDSLQTDVVSPSWVSDTITITTEDPILILSTCNGNSEQRYLVGAKLVSAEDGVYVAPEADQQDAAQDEE